jgi:hypothetical protein
MRIRAATSVSGTCTVGALAHPPIVAADTRLMIHRVEIFMRGELS